MRIHHIGRALVVTTMLSLGSLVFAGNTNWLLKIVDENEQPKPGAQVYWRVEGDYDWKPVVGFASLGENRDGGGYQTVEESVGDESFRQSGKREMLRLQLNYMFRTYAQGKDWGFLKIVQPDCSPVEVRVNFPNDIVWQRIVLTTRADVTVGLGTSRVDNTPPVQNTIPPIAVEITVLDIADQRQSHEPPLSGASISLRYDSTGQVYNAVTDANGVASFEVPLPGIATITVQKSGFRQYQWRANLIVQHTERQRIRLLEMNPANRR